MMKSPRAHLRHVTEFASEAGVTVRALHLYDRLGLLKPAALSDAGYRMYGEAELERLEHILALRFVGFNLDQIKELLAGSHLPLLAALRMQRAVVARQRRRLDSALAAIDEAERALAREERIDLWKTLCTVIEAFKMQNDWEWTKKYYSEEALEKLEEVRQGVSADAIAQAERDWSVLIAEVEAAAVRGIDPSGAEAQALATRWSALLRQFTQGNAEIQSGLNGLWSDPAHWPGDFKRPWSDAADAFIKAVMSTRGT
ncbi:MAG TPA: MerR family transcriptional regulator [Candidatus Cybelea sp.]|jgi:DNA-binding transcriptional MerR regulator|nr:MerR family transcriptional regulator [Candidatus Cybelea sp.]